MRAKIRAPAPNTSNTAMSESRAAGPRLTPNRLVPEEPLPARGSVAGPATARALRSPPTVSGPNRPSADREGPKPAAAGTARGPCNLEGISTEAARAIVERARGCTKGNALGLLGAVGAAVFPAEAGAPEELLLGAAEDGDGDRVGAAAPEGVDPDVEGAGALIGTEGTDGADVLTGSSGTVGTGSGGRSTETFGSGSGAGSTDSAGTAPDGAGTAVPDGAGTSALAGPRVCAWRGAASTASISAPPKHAPHLR
jgi:hypothetical protein